MIRQRYPTRRPVRRLLSNRWIVAALIVVAASGCDKGPASVERGPDQCLRREIFKECLQTVPAGPQQTVTNDWSEVIDECQSTAYYQSIRQESQIKPECRS